MNAKRLFNKIAQKTHMPFYNDGEIVFCVNDRLTTKHFGRKYGLSRPSEYRPWKLAWADWAQKKIRPIPVNMPNDAVLCNPTFFRENGKIVVSFIAGIPTEEKLDYHLYRMFGDSWNTLSEPEIAIPEFARTGFISQRHCCIGGERYLVLYDRQKNEWQRLDTSLERIARAIYDPENPAQLLITGPDETERYCTLRFDVDTNDVSEIRGPAPVYKCCLVGSRVVFSYRESEDLEDYQLHIGAATFGPTDEAVSLRLR